MPVMPREPKEWTVEDLDRLPDDGLQYELLDGVLLVTPAPVLLHQRVAARLHLLLGPACPAGMEVYFARVDWRPDDRTSLQPDLLVVRDEDVRTGRLQAPLVLAVEILSPSTRRKDLVYKRSKYQDAGVAQYWVIDPHEPSITVHELRFGRYAEAGRAAGEQCLRLRAPFAVVISPAELIRGPRPQE
jgi:Uma2 family endonuclease